ncbi:serine acetyltransferase [Mucilaginibacter rubeus]|uniref:Serine acetyltransferase n=1 Tax=Mucilaginibacter rubeus TaxID=2027860 RepID=A0A5C1I241_9SPHI|nr:DapH/DapD/GlmU-related protein [Mucilaginibacter rubeus]QEM11995.1 serine acetyltransferase [Mucilaginibacter rubeus]
MRLRETLKKDIKANKGNRKGQFVVCFYRISSMYYFSEKKWVRILSYPVGKFYNWIFIWIIGIELPINTKVGAGLQIWHGSGLVVNFESVIGENVLLRQSTTIGNKYYGSKCPRIGNNVDIGAHCVIIGDVEVGDNSVIGAGTIVTKSIPANSVAYGNPVKIKPNLRVTDQEVK